MEEKSPSPVEALKKDHIGTEQSSLQPPPPENEDSKELSAQPDTGAVDSARPPGPVATPAEQLAGVASFLTCEHCGKGPFKSRAGLVSHQRWCKAAQESAPAAPPAPAAPAAKPQAIKIDQAFARSTPQEGAERAKAALIGDKAALQGAAEGDARSIGKLVARLGQGHVGVPEIGALACETALPPPLKDAEYTALCAVWGDDALDIPPNMLKFLVTASIFGPRLLAHESIGPAIKAGATKIGQRFGLVASDPAPPPPLPRRPPPPPPPVAAATPPPPPKEPTNNKPKRPRDEPEPVATWGEI